MKEKKTINKAFLGKVLAIILSYIAIAVLVNAGILNRQYTSLLVPIAVNIMLAVSLNLITGFLGELTLGHAGFMSIGAYAGALVSMNLQTNSFVELFLAILVGGLMAAVIGFLIGVPVLRLRGDYLAIVTLAFGEIIKSVLNVLPFTNGAKGLSGIEKYTNYQHYTIVFVIMVITIVIITNMVHSRQGRAICAIRDNVIAAESIGIPVSTFKILAFSVSAFFAGVAGVVYAHNVGMIKPGIFDYNKSIEILVIVVLGGMGSIKGSIIAAVILTILPEALRGADNLRMLLYAIVLIAIMLFNESNIKKGMKSLRIFNKKNSELEK